VNVFIMRHGEAEAKAETDALRVLTQKGRDDIAQMSSSYGDALAQVDIIWTSYYVRAKQTAELMSEHLSKPVLIQDFLSPGAIPMEVLNQLEAHRDQTVLVISHQPLIGIVVDGLANLETGRYRMGTGALAYIKTDIYANGSGELQWLHQPSSTQPVY
jgi:phosphohistidine phosphatase